MLVRLIGKYAIILFLALSGFKYLEYQFFSKNLNLEIYLMLVASIFLVIGVCIAKFVQGLLPSSLKVRQMSKQQDAIDQQRLAEFSQREQEILIYLSHGYTNKEIAAGLKISPNTVKTHLSSIFEKLAVGNRTQAVVEAKSLKIIH